jgi:hypothetical protein
MPPCCCPEVQQAPEVNQHLFSCQLALLASHAGSLQSLQLCCNCIIVHYKQRARL